MQKDQTKDLLGQQFKPLSTFSPPPHEKNAEKGLNFLSLFVDVQNFYVQRIQKKECHVLAQWHQHNFWKLSI